MHRTMISQAKALERLDDQDWLFIDCRFDIRDTAWGEREYERSHIRGALYAHLDRDLSDPIVPGRTGRHPLPSPEALERTFSAWGIRSGTQVVTYDDSSGAIAAARLWWLLKWAGHDAVAVLEGDFKGWTSAGLPCESGANGSSRRPRPSGRFEARFRPEMAADAGQVLAVLEDPSYIVLDARAADRYHGQNETIDPVAGHIRGAASAPYKDNLGPDGSLKAARELRARLDKLAGGRDPDHILLYCGSGVTAAHLALAFAHAGKGIPRLYAGSWSHWITDPERPIATG